MNDLLEEEKEYCDMQKFFSVKQRTPLELITIWTVTGSKSC